jgi:hypothetical protein
MLVIAGLGEAMASVFDITHDAGHTIAGLLGMGGFPVAAVALSISLGRAPAWRGRIRALLWLAHLSWISIVLLVATLALMTAQVAQAYGGQLPQHAPTHLPAGVLGLDGWADRLFVLSACTWVLVAAWRATKLSSAEHQTKRVRDGVCGSAAPGWDKASYNSGRVTVGTRVWLVTRSPRPHSAE